MIFSQNRFPIVALAAAALAVSGCSTYDKVANQSVSVKSVPDEASIAINGKTVADTTDTSLILRRDGDYTLVVSKSGYKPATVLIGHRATGEETPGAPRFELDRTDISVTLEEDPAAKAARENKEAADKAEAALVVAEAAAIPAIATSADKAALEAKTATDFTGVEKPSPPPKPPPPPPPPTRLPPRSPPLPPPPMPRTKR